MCVLFLPACLCEQTRACLILAEGRSRLQNPWNWSYYGRLLATMRVLGTKPGSSARAPSTLAAEPSLQPRGLASHHGLLVITNLHILVMPTEGSCSFYRTVCLLIKLPSSLNILDLSSWKHTHYEYFINSVACLSFQFLVSIF